MEDERTTVVASDAVEAKAETETEKGRDRKADTTIATSAIRMRRIPGHLAKKYAYYHLVKCYVWPDRAESVPYTTIASMYPNAARKDIVGFKLRSVPNATDDDGRLFPVLVRDDGHCALEFYDELGRQEYMSYWPERCDLGERRPAWFPCPLWHHTTEQDATSLGGPAPVCIGLFGPDSQRIAKAAEDLRRSLPGPSFSNSAELVAFLLRSGGMSDIALPRNDGTGDGRGATATAASVLAERLREAFDRETVDLFSEPPPPDADPIPASISASAARMPSDQGIIAADETHRPGIREAGHLDAAVAAAALGNRGGCFVA